MKAFLRKFAVWMVIMMMMEPIFALPLRLFADFVLFTKLWPKFGQSWSKKTTTIANYSKYRLYALFENRKALNGIIIIILLLINLTKNL